MKRWEFLWRVAPGTLWDESCVFHDSPQYGGVVVVDDVAYTITTGGGPGGVQVTDVADEEFGS